MGYPSDDINKFLWMVRIGGGVFPHIKEPDYLVSHTQNLSCLILTLIYYLLCKSDDTVASLNSYSAYDLC